MRAARVILNEAVQEDRLTNPSNIQLPEASVIHRMFLEESADDGTCDEYLCWWQFQGKKQLGRAVVVEVRRVIDRVIAIE